MEKNRHKVVLDTNILISAIVFNGAPAKLLNLAIDKEIIVYTSKFLLSELQEILIKKFNFEQSRTKQIEKKLLKTFKIVYPKKEIFVVRDSDDNKVLEAAIEGNCNYIVTGDKDLLDLATFAEIKIIKAQQFLILHENK